MAVSIRSIIVGVFATALGVFSPVVRAEFVPVPQNLATDARDDRADFNQVFGQTRSSYLPDEFTTPVAQAAPVDFARDLTTNSSIALSSSGSSQNSAIQCSEIQLPDSIRIRPSFGGITPPLSLVENDVDFSLRPMDQGWSGNGYVYHAFSSQYERLSGLETVTLVPTPTALQVGIFGLLVAMGLTAYIRRRMRMRARQRTG